MKIINCVEPCLTSSLRESQSPSMQIRHIMAIGEVCTVGEGKGLTEKRMVFLKLVL